MEFTRKNICRKLRLTALEFGQNSLANATIIGPDDLESPISGINYIMCPTIVEVTLGGVDFKVARFFEDI
jgi:hypothetical protein